MLVKNAIDNTVNSIWPLILVVIVIFSLIRIFMIIYKKEPFIIYKEILSIFFVIYVLMLYHIVSAQDSSLGGGNYTPFKEMFRFELFSDGFNRNTLGNIILFMPLGFYICHYIRYIKFIPVVLIGLITSFIIECMQKYIGRTFDIDDIILNAVGALVGLFIYLVLDTVRKKLPKVFGTDLFLNIIMILIVLLLIFFNYEVVKGFII